MGAETPKECVQVREVPAASVEAMDGPAPVLGRDGILGAADHVLDEVYVPEWRGLVRIRSLTGAERDRFEQSCLDRRRGQKLNVAGLKALLVILSAVDEDGEQLFQLTDLDALQAKSASAIDRIFKVSQRLSGLTEEDVEELAGNFDGDLNDSSGSN